MTLSFQPAVFSYSRNGVMISAALLFPIFGYGLIYGINEYIHGTLTGGPAQLYFTGSFDVFLLFMVAYSLSRRERTVHFYEDSLKITGWKTHVQVPYSEVTNVSAGETRLFGMTISNHAILITVKGQHDPLVIPGNLKNRNLKIDLYSWLTAKVARQSIIDGASHPSASV